MKRISFLFLSLLFFISPSVTASTLYQVYWGTDTSSEIWWADNVYKDDYYTSLTIKGTGKGEIQFYDSSGTKITYSSVSVNGSPYTYNFFSSGYRGIKLVATSGRFWAVSATTSNPLATTVYFEQPEEDPPPPDDPPPDDNPPPGGGGDDPPPIDPPDDGGPVAMTCTATDNGDGSSTLNWSKVTGASYYEVYINGSKRGEYLVNALTLDGSGTAYIKAYNGDGNLIGESNIVSFESTNGGGSDPSDPNDPGDEEPG